MDPDPLPLDILTTCFLFVGTTLTTTVLLVVFLLILLLCSALISASEVAFFSLSPSDVDHLNKEDQASSKRILKLKESPRELLATILISNNFINIAIVIISEIVIRNIVSEDVLDGWAGRLHGVVGASLFTIAGVSRFLSFMITVVVVTFLLVLFGEVAPKIYANINNVKHARLMGRPLMFLGRMFYPLSRFLLSWSGGIEERVYRQRLHSSNGTDRKEIDKAIELTVTDGADQEEVDILKGIIKFGDVETRQIMKSRVDVVGLDKEQGYKEVIQIIKDSGFSRLPVFEESFDSIIGILYVKDLLGLTKEEDSFKWQTIVRDNVLYVPETKKIDELLKEFQSKRTHMAIVVDEYGGSAGIVTLEDIMEEVVGDIRDEFDTDEDIDYVKINDHTYIFEGKTLLNDVVRVLNLENDVFEGGRGNADSLAGLILELENVIPKQNKMITYKNMNLTVNKVNKRRIEKVKIVL